MRPQDIISKKRDRKRLSEAEISSFIKGVTDGSWTDCQAAALLMAIYLKGFDAKEQFFITKAMFASGDVLDFSDIEKPKADKHSTGGVCPGCSYLEGKYLFLTPGIHFQYYIIVTL